MTKPKVIVFDFDGVIVDSDSFGCADFIKLFPSITPHDYKEILCGNFRDGVDKIRHLKIKETPEESQVRREKYAKEKLKCAIFEGMPELLQELHSEGCILALNTSGAERNVLPVLSHHSLRDLFDFMGLVEVDRSKVKKFNLIKEKYNVLVKDIIFVTDTLGDIREADEAGIPSIAVTWGSHDRSYFEREPHDNLIAIVDTVSDLRDKILGK